MTSHSEQLSCQELVELVTDYLEGALTERDRAQLEEHISGCDGCRHYIEQMRATVTLTNDVKPQGLTPEAEEALVTALRDWKAR